MPAAPYAFVLTFNEIDIMPPTPPPPTLYFDGACPVCAREVAMYRRQRGAEHLRWIDASQCSPDQLGDGLTRAAALSRLHLRRSDGSLVSGAAAFTALWQLLPRWAWLGRWLGSAQLLRVLEPSYLLFLRLRRRWRRAP
jgi:predicted DCC family thiol-disulfide oxidoreductase YuxK